MCDRAHDTCRRDLVEEKKVGEERAPAHIFDNKKGSIRSREET